MSTPTNVTKLLEDYVSKGIKVIPVYDSKRIIREYGIPVTEMVLARNLEEAVQASKKLGFPLVMKISSPDVVHKTDIGGVILGISSLEELENAYKKIIENVRKKVPHARIEGVVLEEMVEKHYEVIVGGVRDPQFGPTIMFGMGGVFVEVFKDVAFGIAPLTKEEAMELIDSTKASKILRGYRGGFTGDIDALADVLVKTSKMMWDLKEYIKEMDLNPVAVLEDKKGIKVLDARIVLEKI